MSRAAVRAKEEKTMATSLEDAIRALSPDQLRQNWKARLVTHCEHGRPRAGHCPWCYVQTHAYRQSLADAMWTILD